MVLGCLMIALVGTLQIFTSEIQFKRELRWWWTAKYLHRNHISILIIITCQNKAFNIGWKEASEPLTTCWDRLLWRNDHQHIIMSSYNTHYANSAPFFDIPEMQTFLRSIQPKTLTTTAMESRNQFAEHFSYAIPFFETHDLVITWEVAIS